MLYFGQAVGEDGSEDAGFGDPTRTSIFDYVGVPAHQRWMNGGAFDGGGLNPDEAGLRDFYSRLLNFTISSEALMGAYRDIHYHNKAHTPGYDHRVYSFVRWKGQDRLVIVSNFDAGRSYSLDLKIPEEILAEWGLGAGSYPLQEQLYGTGTFNLEVADAMGSIQVELGPLESVILRLIP